MTSKQDWKHYPWDLPYDGWIAYDEWPNLVGMKPRVASAEECRQLQLWRRCDGVQVDNIRCVEVIDPVTMRPIAANHWQHRPEGIVEVVRTVAAERDLLAQALWKIRELCGDDLDGDKTPGAEIAGMGYDGYARHCIQFVKQTVDDYEDELGAWERDARPDSADDTEDA